MPVAASDMWVPLLIGLTFTVLACLKLNGLRRGIMVGARKPAIQRLCGT
jgi:hypothetical protein